MFLKIPSSASRSGTVAGLSVGTAGGGHRVGRTSATCQGLGQPGGRQRWQLSSGSASASEALRLSPSPAC